METFDAAGFLAWVDRGLRALALQRQQINGLNVFPVADNDTGSNMLATWQAVHDHVHSESDGVHFEYDGVHSEYDGGAHATRDRDGQELDLGPTGLASLASAAARGSLVGARGNSGVILAQLMSGLATGLAGLDSAGPAELAAALSTAATEAERAVAEPVVGTLLTVLRAAAEGAAKAAAKAAAQEATQGVAETGGTRSADREQLLAGVTGGAAAAAAAALVRTREQHPVLMAAGVVDAGGQGLVVLLDALHAAVLGLDDTNEEAVESPPVAYLAPHAGSKQGPAYEVTYLLDADAAAVERLRHDLEPLGDSLVIAGAGELWSVHVHVDNVAAAIEAGIAAGRPHRLGVSRFADGLVSPRSTRAVVALVDGPGSAALLETMGARIAGGRDTTYLQLVAAIQGTGAAEVIVLADDPARQDLAAAAARQTSTPDRTVAVVPTSSVIQGMVALVVSEPALALADDVIAMAQTAAACRTASVTVAAGEVLGRIQGDVVVTGTDIGEVAIEVAARLAAGGGEILTILMGQGAPADLPDRLAAAHPELSVEAHIVAPDTPAVAFGLE